MKGLLKTSILIGISVVGCAGKPIHTSKDSKVDTSHYHVYQWITSVEADELRLDSPSIDYLIGTVQVVRDPDTEAGLRALIEHELQKGGFKATTPIEKPDFYVTFYGKSMADEWISSWEGYTPGVDHVPVVIFPNYNPSQARKYREGIAFITFYDARTKKPTWTGAFQGGTISPDLDVPRVTLRLDEVIADFNKGKT